MMDTDFGHPGGLPMNGASEAVSAVPVRIPDADKVVFLDIDGPIIPCTMYLIDRGCSFKRILSWQCLAVVRELCARTGAKVVFNTTHNQPSDDVADIADACVAAGLPREHIHQDDRTRYPSISRDLAVKEWLARHPGVDWLAFDDVKFTDDERLIVVDPDSGLHTGHLNEALDRFGGRPCIFLV